MFGYNRSIGSQLSCGLTSLDLSKFNTAKVTTMEGMFSGCHNLTSLSLNVTRFNTTNVTNMADMFYYCEEIVSLNLRGFNTSNVTTMNAMFFGCKKLKTIYASTNFTTTKLTSTYSSNYMFASCFNLVGGNSTKYDKNVTDKTYARIDKKNQKGYFTQ